MEPKTNNQYIYDKKKNLLYNFVAACTMNMQVISAHSVQPFFCGKTPSP